MILPQESPCHGPSWRMRVGRAARTPIAQWAAEGNPPIRSPRRAPMRPQSARRDPALAKSPRIRSRRDRRPPSAGGGTAGGRGWNWPRDDRSSWPNSGVFAKRHRPLRCVAGRHRSPPPESNRERASGSLACLATKRHSADMQKLPVSGRVRATTARDRRRKPHRGIDDNTISVLPCSRSGARTRLMLRRASAGRTRRARGGRSRCVGAPRTPTHDPSPRAGR
jgi:hypothetical protein